MVPSLHLDRIQGVVKITAGRAGQLMDTCVNFLTGSCSEQEPQTSSRFRTDVRTVLNRKSSERFGISAKDHCRPGGSVRTIDPNNP
jgi:hypothetical protein